MELKETSVYDLDFIGEKVADRLVEDGIMTAGDMFDAGSHWLKENIEGYGISKNYEFLRWYLNERRTETRELLENSTARPVEIVGEKE